MSSASFALNKILAMLPSSIRTTSPSRALTMVGFSLLTPCRWAPWRSQPPLKERTTVSSHDAISHTASRRKPQRHEDKGPAACSKRRAARNRRGK